jgi:hypothetical protein
MKRVFNIKLHLVDFIQFGTFCEGTYKLRYSIVTNVNDSHSNGTPFLLSKNSKSSISKKYYISFPFNPAHQSKYSFNDFCTFLVEFPILDDKESANKIQVIISVELLMLGISQLSKSQKFKPDEDGYSIIGRNELSLNCLSKGINQYSEVIFPKFNHCQHGVIIHSNLINFQFDNQHLDPSSQSSFH